MTTKLTFHGHSACTIESGPASVLIDPFISGNPLAEQAGIAADDLSPTAIVLTHGHEDHVGDTVAIAKRTGATVYAAYELCNYLGGEGLKRLEPANPGGKVDAPWGWVAFTQAFHSSSYGGKYMGQPMGAVVHIGGKTVYHCGDTGIFGDMKLLGEIYRPDVALIPIGDRFTMGPELATRAAEMIGAPVAVPIHYKTFPPLRQSPDGFEPSGVEVRALEPGETMDLG